MADASGAGIGPFLSILKTDAPWQRFRQVVLVHAVRHPEELTYRDCIERLSSAHPGQMRLIRSSAAKTRRPPCTGGCRRQSTTAGSRAAAGVALSARSSQVMICGNPEMITDTTEALKRRGMRKHRRREPGHITVENYW